MTRRRKAWRWVVGSIAAAFLLAVLAVALLVASEWTYVRRVKHHADGLPTPVEWYEPKERVEGTASPRALPAIDQARLRLAKDALERARGTTMAGGAAAFLVLQDGHVVVEDYSESHGPDHWTDSASMAKTVCSPRRDRDRRGNDPVGGRARC